MLAQHLLRNPGLFLNIYKIIAPHVHSDGSSGGADISKLFPKSSGSGGNQPQMPEVEWKSRCALLFCPGLFIIVGTLKYLVG